MSKEFEKMSPEQIFTLKMAELGFDYTGLSLFDVPSDKWFRFRVEGDKGNAKSAGIRKSVNADGSVVVHIKNFKADTSDSFAVEFSTKFDDVKAKTVSKGKKASNDDKPVIKGWIELFFNNDCMPINGVGEDTPVFKYLKSRNLHQLKDFLVPDSVRYGVFTRKDVNEVYPVIALAIRSTVPSDNNKLLGIHLTFLTKDGKKAQNPNPKFEDKSFAKRMYSIDSSRGLKNGAVIPFGVFEATDELMIAEGFESCLSAYYYASQLNKNVTPICATSSSMFDFENESFVRNYPVILASDGDKAFNKAMLKFTGKHLHPVRIMDFGNDVDANDALMTRGVQKTVTPIEYEKRFLDVNIRKKAGFKTLLNLRNLNDFDYVPRDYIVTNFVKKIVAALVAQGGTGKSFFTLQMAIQVASGKKITHLSNEFGLKKVVYITKEDGIEEVQNRMISIQKQFNLNPKELQNLEENFIPVEVEDRSANTAVTEMLFVEQIADYAKWADLIVFDTLSRFHYLDESRAGEMSQVMSQFEAIANDNNCGVMYVHHVSKASGGELSQASARGSALLIDNSRLAWAMVRATQDLNFMKLVRTDENQDGRYTLEQAERVVLFKETKSSYGQNQPIFYYVRALNGSLIPFENEVDMYRYFSRELLTNTNYSESNNSPLLNSLSDVPEFPERPPVSGNGFNSGDF